MDRHNESTLIKLSLLHFRYPEQDKDSPDIIKGIDLVVRRGEYITIVGANGSGKTTLARIIEGILLPTGGKVEVDGIDISGKGNLARVRKKIGIVFQNPEDQIISTTVEDEIAFGLENYGVPYAEMHSRVRRILEGFDLYDVRKRPTYMLSGGQTQRLALASVLALEPEILIFDESTSMLDPSGRKNLLGVMSGFHKEGKTVLHITHSMDEAAQADRTIVIKEGQVVFDGLPGELFSLPGIDKDWNLDYPESLHLSRLMHKRGFPVKPAYYIFTDLAKVIAQGCRIMETNTPARQPIAIKEPDIEVNGLAYDYLKDTLQEVRALHQVSFTVGRQEGFGIIGKTGSGKSTVLQHLNGLLRPQAGSVRVGNFDLTDEKLPLRDVIRYAGLVMQNPENQFFEFYVGDEIAFGPKNTGYEGKLSDRVARAMELVGLDFSAFKDRPLHTLSGGQKRKVALASILALDPAVLILDEPTAGLDPRSRREILTSLLKLQQSGKTVIISSHNLSDILTLTTQMIILERGRVVEHGETGEILANPDVLLDNGIDPPFITKLCAEINRITGSDIQGICTAEGLLEVLVVKANG